mgnify:CR=1 FL=1
MARGAFFENDTAAKAVGADASTAAAANRVELQDILEAAATLNASMRELILHLREITGDNFEDC